MMYLSWPLAGFLEGLEGIPEQGHFSRDLRDEEVHPVRIKKRKEQFLDKGATGEKP